MATFGVTAPVAVLQRPIAVLGGAGQCGLSVAAAGCAQRDAGDGIVRDVASASQNQPVFRSLFQVGERSEPVSPAVQQLWARPATATASDPSSSTQAPAGGLQPFDLFSDRSGKYSS